jgi:hypothetical protein
VESALFRDHPPPPILVELRPIVRCLVLLLLVVCLGSGCAIITAPEEVSPPPPEVIIPPVIIAEPTCGPQYIAPGEPCFTPPPSCAGDDLFGAPPMLITPEMQAPLVPDGPAEPGWSNVLPTDSGAISPDFGLPREPVVTNPRPNPITVAISDPEFAWDQIADVVSDYFPISREERVQQTGAVLTEGRIETPFEIGSTIFEPQRRDSVGAFNKWQNTLQTIRRRAVVRVVPTGNAYQIGVIVQKQLEDLPRPERATAGAAVLRHDTALPSEYFAGVDRVRPSTRWLELGRDEPLEQELLAKIVERLGPTRGSDE